MKGKGRLRGRVYGHQARSAGLGRMLGLLVGRRLDLDGSFEVAARRAAARVEGDEAREDESRHGADGRRDDQAGVVAAAGRLLLGRAARVLVQGVHLPKLFAHSFNISALFQSATVFNTH